MPKRVVGAPAEFAAWAEFLGRATGSLKYPSADPCFCSPDFYLDSCYLLYQAEINEKEEAEGREWSILFLPLAHAASYPNFQRATQDFPL